MTNSNQEWVRRLVFISPLFFPLYLLKFQVMGVPLTVLEVFTYGLFALWLIDIIQNPRHMPWDKPHGWFWAAALALFVGATIGLLAVPRTIHLPSGEDLVALRTALGVWKGWVLAPILYFAVLTEILKDGRDVKRLLQSFIASSALMSLVCYGFALWDGGLAYDLRFRGFFESANYLSLYLVPALLASVYFLLDSHRVPKQADILNSASLAIMLHALFFTQSYAAVLAVFGALVLYIMSLALRQRNALRNALISLMALGIILGGIVYSQRNTAKFRQFLDFHNRSSTTVRLEVYDITVDLIRTHALLGIGPGLYQAMYQTQGREHLGRPPLEWNIPHPHNIFFAFWLNAGILGLASLLGLIMLTHRRFTYPLIPLWGILLHGLFDTPFWKNDLAMIFWLAIACILILQTHGTPATQDPADRVG